MDFGYFIICGLVFLAVSFALNLYEGFEKTKIIVNVLGVIIFALGVIGYMR